MSSTAQSVRTLPAVPDIERYLLGSILVSPGLIYEAASKVRPDDFSVESYRRVFEHMVYLTEKREPISTVTIAESLKAHGHLSAVGGVDVIEELNCGAIKRNDVGHYCKAIRSKAVMRGFVRLCEQGAGHGYDALADGDELIASLQESLLELQSTGAEFRHIRDVMADTVEELSALRNASEVGCLGLTTTIENLDVATSGIRESEFWVIGARPNVGKTPFGMQVAIAQAYQNIPVLIFSLEMQSTQLACRILSHAGIARPRHVRDPRFAGPPVWSRICTAPESVSRWPLWIDDTPDLSIKGLRHKARYAVAKYGIRLIVIDYLQLVAAPGKGEYEKVTAVAKGLRLLARETKCPILALSQLSRDAKDLSKQPTLGDLRNSGEIEQAAHVVGLLHRPPETDESGREMLGLNGYLIMAKVREGSAGAMDTHFDIDTLTFKGGWNQ